MSIDFGKEDVADLASFQDMVTYSDMLELEDSQHDTQSEGEQGRLHVSNTLWSSSLLFTLRHDESLDLNQLVLSVTGFNQLVLNVTGLNQLVLSASGLNELLLSVSV